MRMRKRKWVSSYLEQDNKYFLRDCAFTLKDSRELILEIGMGMGDFLSQSALENPDKLFIGIEKDETCVAKALKKSEEKNLDNLYIILGDAKNLNTYLPNNSVSKIYLQFNDPWPKKSHHKRRLSYKTYLDLYKEVLKKEGEIIFKTDNRPYFEDSLISFSQNGFIIEEISLDRHSQENDDITTEYEKKFMAASLPVYYVKLRQGEKDEESI